MYELIKRDGRAKRGRFHTVHGVIETPVFMNVGTIAAIKGAVSTADLEEIGTQVELSNTYHLHVRPGDQVIVCRSIACAEARSAECGFYDRTGFQKICQFSVSCQLHIDRGTCRVNT